MTTISVNGSNCHISISTEMFVKGKGESVEFASAKDAHLDILIYMCKYLQRNA